MRVLEHTTGNAMSCRVIRGWDTDCYGLEGFREAPGCPVPQTAHICRRLQIVILGDRPRRKKGKAAARGKARGANRNTLPTSR